mmetsp:Transcript_4195/g.5514  ORF Transcript_4195/g.5514 Transcript_4195/m.5514 type:complete len:142 (+) Transcript_4195:390-815(+)
MGWCRNACTCYIYLVVVGAAGRESRRGLVIVAVILWCFGLWHRRFSLQEQHENPRQTEQQQGQKQVKNISKYPPHKENKRRWDMHIIRFTFMNPYIHSYEEKLYLRYLFRSTTRMRQETNWCMCGLIDESKQAKKATKSYL